MDYVNVTGVNGDLHYINLNYVAQVVVSGGSTEAGQRRVVVHLAADKSHGIVDNAVVFLSSNVGRTLGDFDIVS